MAIHRYATESVPERRDISIAVDRPASHVRDEYSPKARRGRRLGRVLRRKFSFWVFLLGLLFLLYLLVFGTNLSFHGKIDWGGNGGKLGHFRRGWTAKRQASEALLYLSDFPCDVGFLESVDDVVEPSMNLTRFSLGYIDREEKPYGVDAFEPRFGGHQTLSERESSFYARNQTVHCGFVKGPEGSPSTGLDLEEKDMEYISACRIVVSSCIFGSSDFLRRPTSKKVSEYSKNNVCFVMFLDEQTVSKISFEGHVRDDNGYIGLWRIVVVRNLPYMDTRRTGKVPKFLSHRLFPSARYSIWLDSKMRLQTDPMLILEYFLWRKGSEYAISNHYDRHCVWEEVLQNKRLNKYNHTAIDEQFNFYQSDGLTKFDPSDPDTPLPSYVPEGSFIVRAHTPMSNLFSCLWFNEVDRFTSRDQLSFAYTYLKLRRTNPDKPLVLNMFKDCERRAVAKLFRHRQVQSPPIVP